MQMQRLMALFVHIGTSSISHETKLWNFKTATQHSNTELFIENCKVMTEFFKLDKLHKRTN